MTGKFITIEGADGTGKTTLIEELKKILPSDKYVFVREPGSTGIGEFARKWIHNTDAFENANTATQALYLFSASRLELLKGVINPALKSGVNVITDRFALSTAVYQDLKPEWGLTSIVHAILKELAKECHVDKTIYLTCPANIIVERLNSRSEAGGVKDPTDSKDETFFQSLAMKYSLLLNTPGFFPQNLLGDVKQLDARNSIPELVEEVKSIIL